jgi:hypothetical protein
MIITDFVKQTILRIGAVVTIPIRTNLVVESAQVLWNKELGVGEIKLYVKPTEKSEASQKSVTERQDERTRSRYSE